MQPKKIVEQLHNHYRGAAEVSKFLRGSSIMVDLLGAIPATMQIFGVLSWSWLPLALVGSSILSAGLRSYAKSVRTFAHRCRKISFRAYCLGSNVDQLALSNAEIEAPFLSRWFLKQLPARSLDSYYEPKTGVGEKRLLELNAHSAFYTWRLLTIHSCLCYIVSAIIFSIVFAIIYSLAMDASDSQSNAKVLEALCSIALVQICIRSIEAAIEAGGSAKEAKAIEEELVKKPNLPELQELADSYDIERAGGHDPSTWIYKIMRDRLQKQWHSRRSALV